MTLNYRDEALQQRSAGDTALGLAVTADDTREKVNLASKAAQHFAVAARFEELHFESLTAGLDE